MDFSWMAWTTPTAIFFATIGGLLLAMVGWEFFSPGGNPRRGILGLNTTRGDRLFISLLGSAFISLAWLGLVDAELWWALVVCALFSLSVFRYC